MGFERKDYIVYIEATKNDFMADMLSDYRGYKTLIVKGCSTLNEVNKKIYENSDLKRSEWIITKVERLQGKVDVIE